MTLDIHVLSIPRLSGRRAALVGALETLGMSCRVHDGIDRLAADPGSVRQRYGGDAAPGDMCCTLGHLAIWQEVAEAGRGVVVLEDDATVSRDLRSWIEVRAEEVMDRCGFGVLKLEAWGGAGLNRTRPLGKRTGEDGVWRLAGRFVGSAAYAITARTAAQLVAAYPKPGRPVDHLLFSPPFAVPAGFVARAPVLHDVERWGSDIARTNRTRAPRVEVFAARLRGARRVAVTYTGH